MPANIDAGSRRHPDSGGAFKAQIYSPYIFVNKTGLPFRIRSVRSIRTGHHDAAGEHRTGKPFQTMSTSRLNACQNFCQSRCRFVSNIRLSDCMSDHHNLRSFVAFLRWGTWIHHESRRINVVKGIYILSPRLSTPEIRVVDQFGRTFCRSGSCRPIRETQGWKYTHGPILDWRTWKVQTDESHHFEPPFLIEKRPIGSNHL